MTDNITITELQNGMLRLVANQGYNLYNEVAQRFFSEAVVKSAENYRAVPKGIDPQPHERTLEDAIKERLAALHAFAEADKKFFIGNKPMWVGPNERANLKNAVEALAAQGVETVQYEGMTLPVATALQMVSSVEAYAALHSMNEARHKAAILAKRAISTVDEYDYTVGFPENLKF